jgi:hypothetical protein
MLFLTDNCQRRPISLGTKRYTSRNQINNKSASPVKFEATVAGVGGEYGARAFVIRQRHYSSNQTGSTNASNHFFNLSFTSVNKPHYNRFELGQMLTCVNP